MATAGSLITLRPREFLLYGELWHEIIHVTLGVSAFIADFGFFTWNPTWYIAGDTMYLVNGIIECFMNIHSYHESHTYIIHNEGKLEDWKLGNAKRELRDNLVYLLGTTLFSVGALLFLPGVYESCSDEDTCLFWGGLCFTLGSLSFVLGSFLNTMGVSIHGSIEQQDFQTVLATAAIGLDVVGSALYLMGSPFYMPQTAAEDRTQSCFDSDGVTVVGSTSCKGTEWSAGDTGTIGYLLGGFLFLLAKIARMWLVMLKHGEEEHHKAERNRLLHKSTGHQVRVHDASRHIGPQNPRGKAGDTTFSAIPSPISSTVAAPAGAPSAEST